MSDLTAEMAYQQLQAPINAHVPERQRAPNLNLRSTYAAAIPYLTQLKRDEAALVGVLAEELRPAFAARLQAAPVLFLAALHVAGRYRDATDQNEALSAAVEEATDLRRRGLNAAQILALQGRVEAAVVQEIRRGSGRADLLEDNRRLATLLQERWDTVQANQAQISDTRLHLGLEDVQRMKESLERVTQLERNNPRADERADWHRQLRAVYELLDAAWSFIGATVPAHYQHLGRAHEATRWPSLSGLHLS